ncbi:MAG: adenylate/guanylate cyclase domain-containing protein, partial [Halobacteriales archaeon]|nr:adenylate/guanylate cyclase domain-containing protein [Halobacteriales archaeon]
MPERQTRTNTHEEHRRAALPTGTVTFLFTDIEGSTRLLQRVGPDFPRLLDTHVRLINKAVRAHDGVVVNTEGDGLFIAFARAPNGVAAAVDAQRALFAKSWPVGTTVKVRMGLHTGEGALGGSDYVGIDVHRAARVGAAAHGGQILVSSATRSLTSEGAPNGTSFRDLGEHRLEGLDRPERLFQVLAPDLPAEFPPPRTVGARPNNLPVQATAFVGRSRELNEVVELFEESRLVTLTGPGGVGKTRLALQVGAESLDRFADGVFVVRLESIEDPDLIITTIARSIGIVEGGDRPVVEVLRDYLASRRLLL